MKHPFEKSSALILCEAVFVWCGEWGDAARLLDTLSELVKRYSLGTQRGPAIALRGELTVKMGRPQEGCALLRTAAPILEAEQNGSFASVYAAARAEGLAAMGAHEEALRTVEDAIVEAERRGGTFDLPELFRVKGMLLASRSPADERAIDEALCRAIELAGSQGSLAWQLRATTDRTRERVRRGERHADVLGDLRAVYAEFTEGLEMPDLRAARSLLERRFDH